MDEQYRTAEPGAAAFSPVQLRKKVSRLKPRPAAPYPDAVAAFLAGHNGRCLSLLHRNASIDASLLRARAYLRMRRFEAAHVELTQAAVPLGDHARCAEQQFLLGTTLARTGRFDEAQVALANADIYATSSGDRDVVTEAASFRAFSAFLCGNYDEVETIAVDALDERSGSAHARLLEMRALVAALRGDVDRQIALLFAANEHLVGLPGRDLYLEANMLNNLAVPVLEADPVGLADYIRDRASEIAWHEELQLQHFHVTHHLAWIDALFGDHLSAFRRFRAAVDLAPSPARRAEAFVSRGVLARDLEEPINAAECVADAEDQIDRVDWNATRDDERLALVQFAALIAPSQPDHAGYHVDRYKSISQSINRFDLAGHGDPLYRAKETHAFGVIAGHTRGSHFARPLLHEAYRLFRTISSNWRAAIVALDLFELEHDESMLAFALNEASRLPDSWLATRCKRTAR